MMEVTPATDAEVERWRSHSPAMAARLDAEKARADKAEAEVGRLREALQELVRIKQWKAEFCAGAAEPPFWPPKVEAATDTAWKAAREALAGEVTP